VRRGRFDVARVNPCRFRGPDDGNDTDFDIDGADSHQGDQNSGNVCLNCHQSDSSGKHFGELHRYAARRLGVAAVSDPGLK
jgi:hypothetical protein